MKKNLGKGNFFSMQFFYFKYDKIFSRIAIYTKTCHYMKFPLVDRSFLRRQLFYPLSTFTNHINLFSMRLSCQLLSCCHFLCVYLCWLFVCSSTFIQLLWLWFMQFCGGKENMSRNSCLIFCTMLCAWEIPSPIALLI